MKYYAAIQKKEILPSVTVWRDLEGIVLSKISQIEKYKYCMLLLTSGIWKKKKWTQTYKEQIAVCQKWVCGSGGQAGAWNGWR